MNFGQLTEYPFNAQVWGNASDVAMVIVTAVTAWFLIKTFREQQKITRIEEYNHFERIKPKFGLECHLITRDVDETIDRFIFVFNLSFGVLNHRAENIEIGLNEKNTLRSNGTFPYRSEYLDVESNLPIVAELHSKTTLKNPDEKIFVYLEFTLSFRDVEKNKYTQRIFVWGLSDESLKVVCSPVEKASQ